LSLCVVTPGLAGSRENDVPHSSNRPEQEELLLPAIKHSRALHMDIPRIGSVDRRGRGRPVPSAEYVDKGMPLRQSGLPGLMAHEASEFTTVGKTPVRRTIYLVTIHPCDVIKGFLPGQREFSNISVSCPNEPRKLIENRIVLDLESRRRPGQAASEVRVLSASNSNAIDHSARRIVAGDLPCLKISAHTLMPAQYRSFSACLSSTSRVCSISTFVSS